MVQPLKYFGSLKPVTFEQEFKLNLVGDRSKLPRGKLTGGGSDDQDLDCFKSVHVMGEMARKIMEEAQAKEAEDWKAKVRKLILHITMRNKITYFINNRW